MAVDGIGSVTATTNDSSNAISQDEFTKLFLAQLNFQDPLEPVDNREFLTQMAQFTQVQLGQDQVTLLGGIHTLTTAERGMSYLGKTVEADLNGTNVSGTVNAVSFTSSGTLVTIETADGANITDVSLENIVIVR